jgi:molybdate transport system substrate-binding protein
LSGHERNNGEETSVSGAEIQAFMTNGVRGVIGTLGPAFSQTHGHVLTITFLPSNAIGERLAAGAATDVVIATRQLIDDLAAGGKIAAGSDVALARSSLGIAVRKGAPKPDISTPEALKRALLAARMVACSHPTRGGASGPGFVKALERLGIAEEMTVKCMHPPPGTFTATLLVSGEADLAVQQISELMAVDGAELVGPLPDAVQTITTFVGAVHAGAASPEAARALLAYLTTPEAQSAFVAKGLQPA